MNEQKFYKIIMKFLENKIIERLIWLILIVLVVLIPQNFFQIDINDFIDIKLIVTIFIAFSSRVISQFINKIIKNKVEDSLKLTDDYNKILKLYPKCKNKITYINSDMSNYVLGRKKTNVKKTSSSSNFDQYVFPVTYEINCIGIDIKINDNQEIFNVPDCILTNNDELMRSHLTSNIYNQLNIRLDKFEFKNETLILNTSRTTYFNSLITNRAMDYKLSNGFSIRQLYEYGPFFKSLDKSFLSNHIGFNGFVETSDEKIVFILRKNNVSIGKNTIGTSIGASLKTKFSINDEGFFTLDGLQIGIINEIYDELKIPKDCYEFSLNKNIIALYRDMIEGGKPQFLTYIKVKITSNEVKNNFLKFANKKSKNNMDVDGNKLIFVEKNEFEKIYIAPDILIIKNKSFKVTPSTAASCVLFNNYNKLKIIEK